MFHGLNHFQYKSTKENKMDIDFGSLSIGIGLISIAIGLFGSVKASKEKIKEDREIQQINLQDLNFRRVQAYRQTEKNRHLAILDELGKIIEPVIQTGNVSLLLKPLEIEPAYKFQQANNGNAQSVSYLEIVLKCAYEKASKNKATFHSTITNTRYTRNLLDNLDDIQYKFMQDIPELEGAFLSLLKNVKIMVKKDWALTWNKLHDDTAITQMEIKLHKSVKSVRNEYKKLKVQMSQYIGTHSHEKLRIS